jgi:hypothetical protein
MGDTKTFVFRNDNETSNTPPQPPDGLTAEVDTSTVLLSWSPGADNETPAEGLSYNAYLYKQFYDTVWSPMAIIPEGYRLIPALGNVTQNTSWKINGLGTGTYFWSVQSVDNSFAGSQFVAEGSFTIELTGLDEPTFEPLVEVSPNPAVGFIDVRAMDGITSVILFSRTGQKMLEQNVGSKQCRLDLYDMPAGLYLLYINTPGGVFTRKVVLR